MLDPRLAEDPASACAPLDSVRLASKAPEGNPFLKGMISKTHLQQRGQEAKPDLEIA